jgi:DNA-binding NtrC family response regulator
MASAKILLVDDNESVRFSLSRVLEHNGFEVVAAANVNDALRLIDSQTFDVLLSDLRMPNAGDGLTVVSAMRNSNPNAVTLILTGYPEMKMEKTPARPVESVAKILEEQVTLTIQDWLLRVELEPEIISVTLGFEERCGHLPLEARNKFQSLIG